MSNVAVLCVFLHSRQETQQRMLREQSTLKYVMLNLDELRNKIIMQVKMVSLVFHTIGKARIKITYYNINAE